MNLTAAVIESLTTLAADVWNDDVTSILVTARIDRDGKQRIGVLATDLDHVVGRCERAVLVNVATTVHMLSVELRRLAEAFLFTPR